MKTYASVFTLITLFFVLSCQAPALEETSPAESHPGIITTVKSGRSSNFINSDLLGQWKVVWVDKGDNGWHTVSNDACLGSLWYYFGQADTESGDVIEGSYSVTNESCPQAHTGQQLFDDYFNPYGVGFEEWNNIPTYPQRYSFNRATGALTLTRYVSLGSGVFKTMHLYLGTDKQSGFITSYSPYNDIRIQRQMGGPSVP